MPLCGMGFTPCGALCVDTTTNRDHCGMCKEEFLYALPRCPICHKSVCDSCAKRMGGNTFCGTDCSHAFFFGGEEEVAEAEADRYEDGE